MKKMGSAEEYIEVHPNWSEELLLLREMLLSTELVESIKWGSPVYTLNGTNLIGLGAHKHHCGLWFFQGSLLKDNTDLLVNAQENKTKNLRQIRFTKEDKIDIEVLKNYVQEAINLLKQGITVAPPVRSKEVHICKELAKTLKENKKISAAFYSLTPGRQREYNEFINEVKKDTTKQKRLEKITPMILQGIGLNDKYKTAK